MDKYNNYLQVFGILLVPRSCVCVYKILSEKWADSLGNGQFYLENGKFLTAILSPDVVCCFLV